MCLTKKHRQGRVKLKLDTEGAHLMTRRIGEVKLLGSRALFVQISGKRWIPKLKAAFGSEYLRSMTEDARIMRLRPYLCGGNLIHESAEKAPTNRKMPFSHLGFFQCNRIYLLLRRK